MNLQKIICLIGKSGTGKSTIERTLVEYGFIKATSHTTRPMRLNEINGVDYHFVTEEKFKDMLANDELAEYTIYNNNYYGVSKKELLKHNKPVVLIVEVNGFRQLKQNLANYKNIEIVSFYIKTCWVTRLKRLLRRGDGFRKALKRIMIDRKVFKGIEKEVDRVIINNENTTIKEIVDEIILNI